MSLSSKSQLVIRLATVDDLKTIKKIANQNREFIGFVMNVALAESIKNKSLNVVEIDNMVIGFVHFHARKDSWHTLHELAIFKEYQHSGLGQLLFDTVPHPIRLKTTQDNESAINFYQKNGMAHVRTEQGKKRELMVFELQ